MRLSVLRILFSEILRNIVLDETTLPDKKGDENFNIVPNFT